MEPSGHAPGLGVSLIRRWGIPNILVDVLDRYAGSFDPPVRTGARVTSVERAAGDRFRVTAGASTVDARAVVLATGSYRRPKWPAVSSQLPIELVQIHASQYKNPAQLPDGAALVVGTGQSGAQIAEERAFQEDGGQGKAQNRASTVHFPRADF